MDSSEPIELEPVGGARNLLAELESALAGELDAAQLYRSLVPSRDVFLNLLSFKVCIYWNVIENLSGHYHTKIRRMLSNI
jgi:hypothetical protein